MLNIITMPLGDYQTNCYLVWEKDSTKCVVIDPGYNPGTVLNRADKEGLQIEAILLTHGHFDHVGAVREVAAETDCRVYLCEEDLSMPPAFTAGPLYYTDLYADGDTVNAAGLTFRVIATPGHTPGSVCLQCENVLFSGDTLFAGSCGRTDLPGGNRQQMQASLARLRTISENLTVYPGHGPSSTLSGEKASNPYMKGDL